MNVGGWGTTYRCPAVSKIVVGSYNLNSLGRTILMNGKYTESRQYVPGIDKWSIALVCSIAIISCTKGVSVLASLVDNIEEAL